MELITSTILLPTLSGVNFSKLARAASATYFLSFSSVSRVVTLDFKPSVSPIGRRYPQVSSGTIVRILYVSVETIGVWSMIAFSKTAVVNTVSFTQNVPDETFKLKGAQNTKKVALHLLITFACELLDEKFISNFFTLFL